MWLYEVYILVKGNISVANTASSDVDANNANTKVVFKNPTPFTDCRNKISNTKENNSKDADLVMTMYNLI